MVRACVDRFLPSDTDLKHSEGAQRIALLRDKIWPNGATINVRLIGGTRENHADVALAIAEWQRYANIDFRLNNAADSPIRITFDARDGAWSMLGTDALRVPKRQATMNLGFSDGGTYLHEFGHALGAIHEHQNPEGGIKWNRQAVIRDLSGPPNNWDMRTIETNMFAKYSQSQTNGTEVDVESIMLYQIPPEWTLDGFQSRQNSVLSANDRAFISRIYPKADAPVPPLVDDEPPSQHPKVVGLSIRYDDGTSTELRS